MNHFPAKAVNIFPNRKGRTPFHIEMKFTADQWEWLGEQAKFENTSRYNFIKHCIFKGTELEDHSHHQRGLTVNCELTWEVVHVCERLKGHKGEHVCYCGECKENTNSGDDIPSESPGIPVE